MSELSSREREQFAAIEMQLNGDAPLARRAKRLGRPGGVPLAADSCGFWVCLLIGLVAPVAAVLLAASIGPRIGLFVGFGAGAVFAVTLFATVGRTPRNR